MRVNVLIYWSLLLLVECYGILSAYKVCLFWSFLALQNIVWFFFLIEVKSPFFIHDLIFFFWSALESGERGAYVSKKV